MILLIVDDERNIRVYMQQVLEKMSLGFSSIMTAENGYEALEKAKASPPDIIITDVVMPWLSGHELVAALKEINPHCIYIFISGHDDVSYLQEAIVLQAFRYILKPIRIQELTSVLKLAIQKINETKQIADKKAPIKNLPEDSLTLSELGMRHRLLLLKARQYIEDHYMHNIGSREIASHCGISTGYLSALFHMLPDVTIPQYITNVRLKHAIQMMQGEASVSEIASSCGFSSANYFTRLFKQKYNKTPSEMKKIGFPDEKSNK
jgi:two-component system response regulator YesN